MNKRYWWTRPKKVANSSISYLIKLLQTKGKYCRFEYEGGTYTYQSYFSDQVVFNKEEGTLLIKDRIYKNKNPEDLPFLITNVDVVSNIEEISRDEYLNHIINYV